MVTVSPAKAVEDEVPKTKLEVPAPIKFLISAAVTPEANVGEPLPENIPGSAKDVYPLGFVAL